MRARSWETRWVRPNVLTEGCHTQSAKQGLIITTSLQRALSISSMYHIWDGVVRCGVTTFQVAVIYMALNTVSDHSTKLTEASSYVKHVIQLKSSLGAWWLLPWHEVGAEQYFFIAWSWQGALAISNIDDIWGLLWCYYTHPILFSCGNPLCNGGWVAVLLLTLNVHCFGDLVIIFFGIIWIQQWVIEIMK